MKIASRRPQYIRYTLAAMTFIVGLANMIGTLKLRLGWDILFHSWPIDIQYHLTAATIITSLFLLIAPYGLIRELAYHNFSPGNHGCLQSFRKRRSICTALASGLFITLLATDSHFEARSDPPSMLCGYLLLVFGLGIVIVYALGGFLPSWESGYLIFTNPLHLPKVGLALYEAH